MEDPRQPSDLGDLGLLARIALAFAAFWRVLLDAQAARQVHAALSGPAPALDDGEPPKRLPEPTAAPKPQTSPQPEPPQEAGQAAVLHFLGALQREGRFVDFIAEDLPPSVPDADIGAAARMVHRGCRKALDAWVHIEPVLPGDEGAPATVAEGFDARAVTLTGNVQGDPPFHGTLTHHGWRATQVHLPLLSSAADPSVLAPAEVEL